MFVPARALPTPTPGSPRPPEALTAEVCIVGAGAAGIALALSLADAGHRVLLLEGGGFERTVDSQRRYDGRYEGTFVTRPWPGYLSWSRVRHLGGSTNHWAGWCRPLEALDFETRSWIPHSGWPFGRETLTPFYDRACAWVEVPPFPDLLGGNLRTPGLLAGDDVVGDALFFMSKPTRFGLHYRARLADHPRVTVVLDANVTEVVTTPDGRHVDHVTFRAPGGPLQRAAARAYDLAAGGVENPRLLLLSDRVHRQGLGNGHDRVGRFFMDHPHLDAAKLVVTRRLRRINAYKRVADRALGVVVLPVLTVGAEAQRTHALYGASFQLVTRPGVAEAGALRALNQLTGPDEGEEVHTLLGRTAQVPNPDSRVTLTTERDDLGLRRVKLDWRLTALDHEIAARTLRLFGRSVARHGVGRLRADVRPDEPWPRAAGGCHHMGTTRMHASPAQGVVDPSCRVHGLTNLYVAGSSVFPTAGYANPTLTLLALALRLADHLHGALG
jgi:choline dehydrogenase-like flavoprotein